jgi:hypothetical protein
MQTNLLLFTPFNYDYQDHRATLIPLPGSTGRLSQPFTLQHITKLAISRNHCKANGKRLVLELLTCGLIGGPTT